MIKKLMLLFFLLAPIALSAQGKSKNGLLFDKGPNRGLGFIDSVGTDYSLRYSPIFITNDSTIPIHIHIAFSSEYNYSLVQGDVKFKLIPLPKEWAQNGTTDIMFDNMIDKLPDIIDRPIISYTIKPGEKIDVAIGTLVIRPRDFSISINTPFVHSLGEIFPTCDIQINDSPLSNLEIPLGLKLDINEICTIVPCGYISYLEQ